MHAKSQRAELFSQTRDLAVALLTEVAVRNLEIQARRSKEILSYIAHPGYLR